MLELVEIRAADAAGDGLYEDLPGSGHRFRHVADRELLSSHHCGAHGTS
jgi:hypothetical protein